MDETKPVRDLPRCRCGFTREHSIVHPEPHYSLPGTLLVLFAGRGARPKSIDYRCPRCGTLVETVTDREVLQAFC